MTDTEIKIISEFYRFKKQYFEVLEITIKALSTSIKLLESYNDLIIKESL